MGAGFTERIDGWAGAGLEASVSAHHRRRLRRVGRGAQLDPPIDTGLWAAGDPPPRPGCAWDVLIDGEQALGELASALAGARSHVHLAGWHITPSFGLTRGAEAKRLRDLLGELAEQVDVRVLLWAGAPGSLFTPGRKAVRAVADELTRGTRVRVALDAHERPMHCHHEKLALIDGEVAFVGGIDLTSLGGDRWDSPAHPARGHLGWHDVGSRLRGPAVADVAAHWTARWHAVTGERLETTPAPGAVGSLQLQIVRTVPERIYPFAPTGDFRILEAYRRALRSARELVYLESQFLWSPDIVGVLADKLRRPPTPAFRLVVVLPAKPNNGKDTTRGQLGMLAQADADGGGGRFLAATITSRSGGISGPLYVHAKVGVVDDRWLTLGSANLNEHSFFNDTEVNVVCCDADLARATRLRLWSEHLELPAAAISGPPARVVDELWRPIAADQLARRRDGAPATHRLCELPGVSRRVMGLLGPLDSLVVDG